MSISEQKNTEKLLTALKSHTSSSVYNNERYKIPIFISNRDDVDYKESTSKISASQKFHYNDKWYSYKYSIDNPQYTVGILKVDNMPYNSFQNRKNKKSFVCTMHNLLYQRYCEPFIIFINGKFVNWDYISIVFDCDETYILLHGEQYNWYVLKNAKIDMVILPFKVDYIGEESNDHFDMMYDMFKSYLQDSLSYNDDGNSTIIVPGIDEVYEYAGMVYNVGAWLYTQLKYEYLGILSDYKINKLKKINIIKKEYDSAGNVTNVIYMKFNALDRDSYNRKMYTNICCYTSTMYANKAVLRFNSNGIIDNAGSNIIAMFNSDIKIFNNLSPTSDYFYTNINNQLYKQNYLIFKDGYFYPNCDSEIFYNIFHNKDSDNYASYSFYIFYYSPIEAIINHANNHFSEIFLKNKLINYLISSDESEISYIKDSLNPLSFNYTNNDSYKDNKDRAINSIIKYDPTLLNPLFTTNIESVVLTGAQINNSLSSALGTFTKDGMKISRSKYDNHESYIMIFKNGELLEDYSNMIVYSNFFYIPLTSRFNNKDQIEILYFNNVNNNELEFELSSDMVTESDKLVTVPIATSTSTETQCYAMKISEKIFDKFISSDELKIFCEYPENIIKYKTLVEESEKISFNISMRDDDNNLYIYPYIDYNTKLTAISSRKFIYQRLYVDQKAYRIELDKRFKYCDNQKQYILFINGRRMNDESFLITIPKHTRPFWNRYLYIAKFANPGDRIEIFYVPDELIDINVNHESSLETNGYIETDKTTIDVPYDPRLYLLFINGKKIARTDIIQVDSSTFRISKDQQSINNLMINPIYSNSINEIKQYMNNTTLSEYDSIIQYIKNNDDLSTTELDKLFNIFVVMSNTETDKTKQNVGKIAILNEIIRDFWIASGYPYNEETFVYDYEILLNDMNIVDESYRFVDLPVMDASQFINIIKNELILLYFHIYNGDEKIDEPYNIEKGSAIDNLYFQWVYVQNIYNNIEIQKQSISYTLGTLPTVSVELTTHNRTWMYPNTLSSDISFDFVGSSATQETNKKIDIKFVNGVFYGNIDENILKYVKNEYDWVDSLMLLVPKDGVLDSYTTQEQQDPKYTANIYTENNIVISNLNFNNIDSINNNNNITTITTSSIVNEYTISDILGLVNKKLQDHPELVLDDYIIGNNKYFVYACPSRLAYKDSIMNIEFIMPDPHSDDIKQNCRDDKATPIYTSGSWDDITNHNLFEPLEKMEMIYLGEYLYTNPSGFSELYSVWRSNGYFTRLFDNYKFSIVIRFKDEDTDTVHFIND